MKELIGYIAGKDRSYTDIVYIYMMYIFKYPTNDVLFNLDLQVWSFLLFPGLHRTPWEPIPAMEQGELLHLILDHAFTS